MMVFPKFIDVPAKISIVSPAGAIQDSLVNDAEERLRQRGFEVVIGQHACGKHYVFSGTVEERVADLQAAMDDESVSVILCARGGYGTVQIIDKLDFTEFQKNPKWLVGFSDITVLHAQLAQLGIASIHASMPINYAENRDALDDLLRMLEGKQLGYGIDSVSCNRLGVCRGILTGGNLSIINGLRATPYDQIAEGRILFLEDLNEDLYHIERLLQNLKLGGVLEGLSGMIVGQFTKIRNEPPLGKTLEQLILDLTASYAYPVAFNFPAGHVDDNRPLILGASTELVVRSEQTTLQFHV